MKKILFTLGMLGSVSLWAQFNVSGTIKDYTNGNVLIKINEGAIPTTINKVKTDQNGKFTVKVPTEFRGILNVSIPSGANYKFLTDNESIVFEGALNQQQPKIISGKSAIEFEQLEKNENLKKLNNEVFPHLLNYYSSSDEFYNSIVKEKARIEKLTDSKSSSTLVSYVKSLQDLVKQASVTPNEETSSQILKHLVSDDERLEGSGQLFDLVYNYIIIQFNLKKGESQDINLVLSPIIDELLEKTDLQTSRGQSVLVSALNVLNKDQFPELNKKYVSQAQALTCTINHDLKITLADADDLKIGSVVPDIKFDKTVKGKKSLFDIKATKKIVIFWASWCPACVKEMPFVKEYYENFKKEGGEIVAISLDFNQADFENATKDFGWYNYTELLKWDSEIAKQYKVNSTPTLFLLDKDNKLVKKGNHISDFITQ